MRVTGHHVVLVLEISVPSLLAEDRPKMPNYFLIRPFRLLSFPTGKCAVAIRACDAGFPWIPCHVSGASCALRLSHSVSIFRCPAMSYVWSFEVSLCVQPLQVRVLWPSVLLDAAISFALVFFLNTMLVSPSVDRDEDADFV